MAILCCRDPEGAQFFWTGYVSEVHGNTAIQIATTDVPDYIRKGDLGQHELRIQQILLSTFGASPNRIELFDLVNADHNAMLTQSTGLPPKLEEQAMLREPANIDARWKAGGEAML
eukprot:13549788-Heterocapsa_arctica.AAC.1